MVYVTGDIHGDPSRFSIHNFPEQRQMTKDDIVIICGDFGLVWNHEESSREKYWLDWLDDKPFTTCFVDGNHENFNRLFGGEFLPCKFHDGYAHKIRKSIYHLGRGSVFRFEGKKFFCMGGASSHDVDDGILDEKSFSSHREFLDKVNEMNRQHKMFRINNVSWWEQELPTKGERKTAWQQIRLHNRKVDYVITHCLPKSIAAMVGFYETDTLTTFFDNLVNEKGLEFDKWFCGHYHIDHSIYGKYNMLYNDIVRVL